MGANGAEKMKGIFLQGITKSYGSDVILDNLNLKIPAGKFFALIGPSGCGKTTILRMMLEAGWQSVAERMLGWLNEKYP